MEVEVKTRIPLKENESLPWVLISDFSKGTETPGARSPYLQGRSGEADAKEKQREMKRKAAEGEEKTRQGQAWKESSFKPVLAEAEPLGLSSQGWSSLGPKTCFRHLLAVTLGVFLHLF